MDIVDVLGHNTIRNRHELEFLSIYGSLYRRLTLRSLDLRTAQFKSELIDGTTWSIVQAAIDSGGILFPQAEPATPVDFVACDNSIGDTILETSDKFVWSYGLLQKLDIEGLRFFSKMPYEYLPIMYAISYWSIVLKKAKPLKIELDKNRSRFDVFAPILLLKEQTSALDGVVIQMSKELDIDYDMLMYQVSLEGNFKSFSSEEKIEHLKVYDEGSVGVLVQRKSVEGNRHGRLLKTYLVRYDGCQDEAVKFTSVPVLVTYEDRVVHYLELPDDIKLHYTDLLEPPTVETSSFQVWLSDLGTQDGVYDEPYVFVPLSKSPIFSYITHSNELYLTEFSEIDLAYWLLKYYDIDFNETWFKEFYNLKKPMYDILYEEPVVDRSKLVSMATHYNRFDLDECDIIDFETWGFE